MSAQKKTAGVKPVFKQPKYVLKVKVEGPRVHRKGIAVPDLVRICAALQSAVHRQAEAMEKPSTPTLRRGPITATAQEECTLELVDLKGGSTDLVFRYAKTQQPLPIPEFATFGSDVLARIAETVKDFGGRKHSGSEVDAGVLDSLRELGEVLDKNSVTKISLTVPRHNGRPRAIKAVLNSSVRDRITTRVKLPTQSQLTVEGKLEMADFKETGKLCRVHPPIGLPLQCSFDPWLEDQIYGALRRPVRVSGTARLNPVSSRPEELRIEKIEILDELLLGARDFFASRTLEQLAASQGVHPMDKPEELTGGWPNDESVDEFVSSIYLGRG